MPGIGESDYEALVSYKAYRSQYKIILEIYKSLVISYYIIAINFVDGWMMGAFMLLILFLLLKPADVQTYLKIIDHSFVFIFCFVFWGVIEYIIGFLINFLLTYIYH